MTIKEYVKVSQKNAVLNFILPSLVWHTEILQTGVNNKIEKLSKPGFTLNITVCFLVSYWIYRPILFAIVIKKSPEIVLSLKFTL